MGEETHHVMLWRAALACHLSRAALRRHCILDMLLAADRRTTARALELRAMFAAAISAKYGFGSTLTTTPKSPTDRDIAAESAPMCAPTSTTVVRENSGRARRCSSAGE